jgi:hypothetical protein
MASSRHDRHTSSTARHLAAPIIALGLGLGLGLGGLGANAAPPLWGYGVKPCRDFLAAAPSENAPTAVGGFEYLHYREWLAGLISGLNLATASDVLAGAELDAALTRIRARCQSNPGEDFFNASMALVKSLNRIKGKGKEKKEKAD